MSNKEKAPKTNSSSIIVAIIGAIGTTIIVAYLGYQGVVRPRQATQTALAEEATANAAQFATATREAEFAQMATALAKPTKTVTDTSIPTSTPTPQLTLDGIAKLELVSLVRDDGTITQRSHLLIADLGQGELELSAPETIKLRQSGLVRLIITPDTALGNALKVLVEASQSITTPTNLVSITDRIGIYPVMVAELKGGGVEVDPSGPQKKVVVSNSQIVWSWIIVAKEPGNQKLIVTISVPLQFDGVDEDIAFELKNISIQVQVQTTPTLRPSPTITFTPSPTFTVTPTPTATKTFVQRARDNVADNTALLIGSILAFIVAVPGAIIAIVNNRRKARKEDEQARRTAVKAVNDLTVEGIAERAGKIEDVGLLEDWLAEEQLRKNRKGAIDAIKQRIRSLNTKDKV